MDNIWFVVILVLLAIVVYKILSGPQKLGDKSAKYAESAEKFNDDVQYAPYVDDGFTGYYVTRPDGTFWEPGIGWFSRRGLLPWWNSTRDTKNMSYDIRGDVWPNYRYVGPWLNSSIIDRPYRAKPLY